MLGRVISTLKYDYSRAGGVCGIMDHRDRITEAIATMDFDAVVAKLVFAYNIGVSIAS